MHNFIVLNKYFDTESLRFAHLLANFVNLAISTLHWSWIRSNSVLISQQPPPLPPLLCNIASSCNCCAVAHVNDLIRSTTKLRIPRTRFIRNISAFSGIWQDESGRSFAAARMMRQRNLTIRGVIVGTIWVVSFNVICYFLLGECWFSNNIWCVDVFITPVSWFFLRWMVIEL